MVLILDGKPQKGFPESTESFYKDFPVYREAALNFLSIECREIGCKGVLYVGQREFAVTSPQDVKVKIIGSDDATTCIIAVLRHSTSGVTALTHLDGTDVKQVVVKMIKGVQELSSESGDGNLELHLVGGYLDERGYSDQIFIDTLSNFQSHPMKIHVTLACVGELNTILKNGVPWPIIYGAGLDLQTGKIFPATFSDRGPDEALRHARLFSHGDFMEIYDFKSGLLKIGPFKYRFRYDIDYLLNQSDGFLLENFSTSPLVEPPHYVEQMRNTWKFVKENPDPSKTVFPDGKPHYFKRNDDCSAWVPTVI